MSQLHRSGVLRKTREQPSQSIPRAVVAMKARWKLKKNAAQFPGSRQRCNPLFENANVARQDRRGRVRELLPALDREFEAGRCALRPSFRGFRIARVIEGRIDLDGVEVAGIETKFVGFPERIENPGPRPRTGARRIAPTAGANPPDTGVIAFRRL